MARVYFDIQLSEAKGLAPSYFHYRLGNGKVYHLAYCDKSGLLYSHFEVNNADPVVPAELGERVVRVSCIQKIHDPVTLGRMPSGLYKLNDDTWCEVEKHTACEALVANIYIRATSIAGYLELRHKLLNGELQEAQK